MEIVTAKHKKEIKNGEDENERTTGHEGQSTNMRHQFQERGLPSTLISAKRECFELLSREDETRSH